MRTKPDNNIVTVHINGVRYRGAYEIRGGRIVVSAYGLRDCANDMAVLSGETGKVVMNLAKLMLIEMVKKTIDVHGLDPGLSQQGSTTRMFC